MKILGIFLNQEIRTGGHIRCLELFEGLAERGYAVKVLLNKDLSYTPRYFSFEILSAPYQRNKIPPASLVFRKAVRLWEKTNPESFDIILAFSETHYFAASYLKKKLKIPLLFALQSNAVKELQLSLMKEKRGSFRYIKKMLEFWKYSTYEKRVAAHCNGIVFQSTFDRNDYLDRNKQAKAKTYIIGGNIGEPRFTRETEGINKSNEVERILFMGTLGERKGLQYLIEAFILLCNNHNNIELHIAGPGTPQELNHFEEFLEEKGFRNKVVFYGRVPSTFPLMESCDLMIAPSIFDSYPDVILLALHAGIPVLASKTGGIPDILFYDELLFEIQNVQAIYNKIDLCIKDHSVYLKVRRLCEQRRAAFHFDWPEKWIEVIKTIKEEM